MNGILGFIAGLFKSSKKGGAPVKTKAKAATTVGGGVIAAACALIQPWEGYYGKTYNDIVGVPTVCYGETDKAAVAEGRKHNFTKDECVQMLAKRIPKYEAGMNKCLRREIPKSVRIAMISATYNIGTGGMCGSTMMKRMNAGDFKGACEALLMWNKAGGRVIKGLDNRRRDERRVCLGGL
jgi:lysozyme